MIKKQATLTSPRQANATPSVPQRPDVSPARHLIAALVKMAKKHTKKNKISPFRGGVSFFFVCFFVIFTRAAIAGLTGDTSGRCGTLGDALAWRGDVSVACFLSFCWLFDTNFVIL